LKESIQAKDVELKKLNCNVVTTQPETVQIFVHWNTDPKFGLLIYLLIGSYYSQNIYWMIPDLYCGKKILTD